MIVSQYEHKISRNLIAPLLSNLIKNRCVNNGTIDSGHELKNAKILETFFQKDDIYSSISTIHKDRSSIISMKKGSLKNPTVYALMGHLDVVPAVVSNWSFDPFGGEIDDNWVYGRGAVDMLGQIAIMATAYREVLRENGPPLHTIKFIGVADEEADGLLGAERVLRDFPDVYSCDYMLTELGGYFIGDNHIAINSSEKGVIRVKLSATGTAGHGSMPFKADNAALKIASALMTLQKKIPKARITTEAIKMVEDMPLDATIKKKLLNLDSCLDALEQVWEKSPGLAKLIHSALHITISPGIIEAGTKVNVIPSSAQARLDIRLQNGDDRVSILRFLGDVLKNEDVKISSKDYFAPNSSSINTPFYRTIQEVAKDIYPNVTLVPTIPAGVTDGRYWREKGSTVYGFSLFSNLYTYDFFSKRLHGVDEKIDIKSLAIGFSFYRRLLEKILY